MKNVDLFIKSSVISALFVVNLLLSVSAQELGIRTVEIPVENNRVSLKTVAQEMLRVAGSEVVLPDEFLDQTLKIHPVTLPLGLIVWNKILDPLGGDVSVNEGRIFIQVDLNVFEDKLDEVEGKFLTTFGVERESILHRLSPPETKGPPVVVVHGMDSGIRLFKGMLEVLVTKGYDVYFFEYPNDDRIERNAFRLSETLKTLPSERRKNLSLVTVSMGGLISQLMLETPELYVEGVSRLIACVPPFQGSEMAALRGFVEIGDHALDVVFDPKDALDVWGDGMGRAGIDLQPESLLIEKLDTLERNPKVTYSILAGNKGMFDPAPLREFRDALKEKDTSGAWGETTRRLALERLEVMLKFQTPNGDGAVSLESAVLEGVPDREVLPYHHLQFLTGFQAEEEKIPALTEVLGRLPTPR